MMYKKGAGLFDGILIGFLVFSFVMMAGTVIIGDWQDNYEDIANLNNNGSYNNATSSFSNTYDTINNITGLTDDIKSNVVDADITGEDTSAGSISSMSRGAYSAIRLIPQTFGLFNSIAGDIGSTVGIQCKGNVYDSKNCWVIDIFMYIFIITLIFGLVYWARGFKVRG